MHWLSEVPTAVLTACLAMLPRLEAEESLRAVTRASLGSGMIDANTAREIGDHWRSLADGEANLPIGVPGTGGRRQKVAPPAVLAGAGIGLRRVKPKAATRG